MKEKNKVKILGLLLTVLIGVCFSSCTYAQHNKTFISVTTDSVSQRGDTLWFTDDAGSVSYLRTSGDSIFFGDVTGEKTLGQLSVGGTPGGVPGDIQYNNAGAFGAAPMTTNGAVISITGELEIKGNSRTAGFFYEGTTDPSSANRLNYDGEIHAMEFTAIDSITIEGKGIRFNESEGVFEFQTGKGETVWQGALEDLVQVYNNTGTTITNGTPGFLAGSIGDSIALAGIASADIPQSIAFLGLFTGDIPNGDWGFLATRGKVRGLNTSALSLIGALFLSSDSSVTMTKPAYPDDVIIVGGVLKVHATEGIIYVSPSLALRRELGGKGYNFTTQGITAGTFYRGGFYSAPAADANLTQASLTQTFGSANNAYSAHPFIVTAAAGTATGGVVGLRVTGTSITDGGVRTAADADTILTDITSVATDEFYEAKKFLGTVTYELITISGSPTTFALDFNYGYAKYEDIGNRDFYVFGIEVVGLAAANDATFNVELLHHKSTDWTYSAAAFIPGNGAIAEWSTDLGTEDNLVSGEDFSWKRNDLTTFIDGNATEGMLIRITTGTNNSVQSMDLHISAALDR